MWGRGLYAVMYEPSGYGEPGPGEPSIRGEVTADPDTTVGMLFAMLVRHKQLCAVTRSFDYGQDARVAVDLKCQNEATRFSLPNLANHESPVRQTSTQPFIATASRSRLMRVQDGGGVRCAARPN
jgi:hypothetical protein